MPLIINDPFARSLVRLFFAQNVMDSSAEFKAAGHTAVELPMPSRLPPLAFRDLLRWRVLLFENPATRQMKCD